jgi:hypothetical protein
VIGGAVVAKNQWNKSAQKKNGGTTTVVIVPPSLY